MEPGSAPDPRTHSGAAAATAASSPLDSHRLKSDPVPRAAQRRAPLPRSHRIASLAEREYRRIERLLHQIRHPLSASAALMQVSQTPSGHPPASPRILRKRQRLGKRTRAQYSLYLFLFPSTYPSPLFPTPNQSSKNQKGTDITDPPRISPTPASTPQKPFDPASPDRVGHCASDAQHSLKRAARTSTYLRRA